MLKCREAWGWLVVGGCAQRQEELAVAHSRGVDSPFEQDAVKVRCAGANELVHRVHLVGDIALVYTNQRMEVTDQEPRQDRRILRARQLVRRPGDNALGLAKLAAHRPPGFVVDLPKELAPCLPSVLLVESLRLRHDQVVDVGAGVGN